MFQVEDILLGLKCLRSHIEYGFWKEFWNIREYTFIGGINNLYKGYLEKNVIGICNCVSVVMEESRSLRNELCQIG